MKKDDLTLKLNLVSKLSKQLANEIEKDKHNMVRHGTIDFLMKELQEIKRML